MRALSEVPFATSNEGKFREASLVVSRHGIRLVRLESKGPEIQSEDVEEIASHAALHSAARYGRGVVVEDTALFIDALNGFPGASASYVYRTLGPRSILLLLKGKSRRTATFVSAVAYCEPSGSPVVFTGRLAGSIVPPRGRGGFGFDPIFRPEGRRMTIAELSMSEKCKISHRAIAFRSFAAWFVSEHRQRLSAQP